MKRILSTILALALLMSLAVIGNTLPVSASTDVIYSGLPTGIDAEGGEIVGDITFTKNAKEGSASVFYDSENDVIDMKSITLFSEAQININHAAENKEAGGIMNYIFEFETGENVTDLIVGIAARWEGLNPKFPTSALTANSDYTLVLSYDTQNGEFSWYLNDTKIAVTSASFYRDGSTEFDIEKGITGASFRFQLQNENENVSSVKLKNISVIKTEAKTGYGTYFSGLGDVEGTAKIENGVKVYGDVGVSTKKFVNNGDGTWGVDVGEAENWASAYLKTRFAVNKATGGIAYFKYNFITGADKAPTTINTYFGGTKVQVGGIAKNTAYEFIFKYNTQTGAGELSVNGTNKGTYSFAPETGISDCLLDFLPNGTVTLNNVEVGIAREKSGTVYGQMIGGGFGDVWNSTANEVSKKNMVDGASFIASYVASATATSITKEGNTLKYADNDAGQWGGEITSKLLFPATSAYEKKGFLYYEYVVSFTGVPSAVYLDIIPVSGTPGAKNKVCLFEEKNEKIQNNTSTGSANIDDTGAKDYTIGIAYEVSSGEWCVMMDGVVSPGQKMNTKVDTAAAYVEKIAVADGIQGVQMRYFGNYNGNNSSVVVKDATVKFCPYDNEQTIGDIVLDKEAGTASITITKDAFNSKIDNSVKFMIASYTKDRLAAINYEEITLKAGERTYTIDIGDKNGGTEIKAFLWNDEYTPLRIK